MDILIIPLADRLLVKVPKQVEEVRASGLVIPAGIKEPSQVAEVLAVGNGRRLESGARQPLEIKEGDQVLYAKFSGSLIHIEEEDYLILREADVLAVLDN